MKFQFAKITNSRLMGSMGLRISWMRDGQLLNQYFLLDAEGLGIADYVSIKGDDNDKLNKEEDRLMGGFGANRIYISEEEAVFLVKYYSEKNKKYQKNLPDNFNECDFLLNKEHTNITIENLFFKLCKTIENSVEFINYMTMRFIARDREALFLFSNNEQLSKMHITNINGVLLKNEVKKCAKNNYISTALYEDNDGHYTSKIGFNIDFDKRKLNSILIVSKKEVNSILLLNEIRKIEYIGIYDITNIDYFLNEFENDNSNFMKTEFEKGIMFTEFNKNNDHVKNLTYYISDDIYAIYYINFNNQLIVSNYTQKERIYLDAIISEKYKNYITLKHEYMFDASVIYEFAQGGYDDFYEFMNYEE